MDKLYNEIIFANKQAPDINADNLNAMSHAIEELDNRLIEGYTKAVLAGQTAEALNQTVEQVQQDADNANESATQSAQSANDAAESAALARETAENIGSIIVPKGSVLFENLPAVASMSVGDMYNILNDFVTTADFIIGAGFPYPLGTNVYKTQGGLLDVFAGAVRVDNDTIKYNANGQLTLGLDDAESEGF